MIKNLAEAVDTGLRTVSVKIGKEEYAIDNAGLAEAVILYSNLKDEMDSIKSEMENFKELIVSLAKDELGGKDASTISFLAGGRGVKVGFSWSVNIGDEPNLRGLLGDRWDLLVKSKTTYTPEAKLREMAMADDAIKGCLEIKERAPSVSVL